MIKEILKSLNINENRVIKKKHGNNKEIIALEFFESLVSSNSIDEAAHALGISRSTMTRTLKTLDLDKPSGNSWSQYLTSLAGYKKCYRCMEHLPLDNFNDTKGKNNSIVKLSYCRDCKSEISKEWRLNNPDRLKELNTSNLENNRHKIYAHNAKYRATKLNATPKWADHAAIAEFYKNCPAGYEVDHIYPLQGENVCGLHVLINLQYLTVFENRSKSNRINS